MHMHAAGVALKLHRHPQYRHFLTQTLDFMNQLACQKAEICLPSDSKHGFEGWNNHSLDNNLYSVH